MRTNKCYSQNFYRSLGGQLFPSLNKFLYLCDSVFFRGSTIINISLLFLSLGVFLLLLFFNKINKMTRRQQFFVLISRHKINIPHEHLHQNVCLLQKGYKVCCKNFINLFYFYCWNFSTLHLHWNLQTQKCC